MKKKLTGQITAELNGLRLLASSVLSPIKRATKSADNGRLNAQHSLAENMETLCENIAHNISQTKDIKALTAVRDALHIAQTLHHLARRRTEKSRLLAAKHRRVLRDNSRTKAEEKHREHNRWRLIAEQIRAKNHRLSNLALAKRIVALGHATNVGTVRKALARSK